MDQVQEARQVPSKSRFPLFAATRTDGRTLVEQAADVLRQAVLTGFYRPGERLPPMRALCRAAGVSMIVMNEVVEEEKAEYRIFDNIERVL